MSLDKKFLEAQMFYEKKIDNLEAKLAESEKLKDDALYNYAWLNQELSDTKQKLKDKEDSYNILCCNHQYLGKNYNELKQQLAEKEIRMKESEIFYKREINRRDTKLANQKAELRHHNQDKIELLEKVRTLVAQLEVIGFPEYSCSDGFESCQDKVDDIITSLINEIKGE